MPAETVTYSGVLLIHREELGPLGAGSGPALWDARLVHDAVVIVWEGGAETTLS